MERPVTQFATQFQLLFFRPTHLQLFSLECNTFLLDSSAISLQLFSLKINEENQQNLLCP